MAAVAGDDLFEVPAEVFIQRHRGVALPCFEKDFGDGPPAAMRCTDHSDWPVVFPFDDHLAALLDLCQHRSNVAGKLGFCDAERRLVFYHSVYSTRMRRRGADIAGRTGPHIWRLFRRACTLPTCFTASRH
jgi:hypothetical protein